MSWWHNVAVLIQHQVEGLADHVVGQALVIIGTAQHVGILVPLVQNGLVTIVCSAFAARQEGVAGHVGVAAADEVAYTFFSSASEAEGVWANNVNMYGSQIGVGSLVKFASVTIGGESYWKIDDYCCWPCRSCRRCR